MEAVIESVQLAHIILPLIALVIGIFIPKMPKKYKKLFGEVAKTVRESRDAMDKASKGELSGSDIRNYHGKLEALYNKVTSYFSEDDNDTVKKSNKSVKLFIILATSISILFVVSGCSTYRRHVAPYIPTVRIEGEVGGKGMGASVGFESKWEEGERKRKVIVNPEVKNDAAD